jgi:predicted transcriptional regulator
MGRPPKAPEERLEAKNQITVRLSGEGREQLDQLADELGDSAGEVVRRALAELYARVFRRGGTKK